MAGLAENSDRIARAFEGNLGDKNMTFFKTIYADLFYAYCDRRKCWYIIAADTKNRVGWPYVSDAELLADLPRFVAESWGDAL